MFGQEERLRLFMEGCLAGVVEAEEDDGIFCRDPRLEHDEALRVDGSRE